MEFAVSTPYVVYSLRDQDGKPFYVGMGAPDRPYKHIAFAYQYSRYEKAQRDLTARDVRTVRRILAEWGSERTVQVNIEGQFASREDATSLEARLIQAYEASGIELVNVNHTNKIRNPRIVERQPLRHASEWTNNIAEWLVENCRLGIDYRCSTKAAYENYRMWAEARGEEVVGRNMWLQYLQTRGVERRRQKAGQRENGVDARTNVWRLLGLKLV